MKQVKGFLVNGPQGDEETAEERRVFFCGAEFRVPVGKTALEDLGWEVPAGSDGKPLAALRQAAEHAAGQWKGVSLVWDPVVVPKKKSTK